MLLEVTFLFLLFFFLTLHEISLYFTLITQNFSLSLSLSLSLFPFRKFLNWLNITRYNSCLFGMKFISCLFYFFEARVCIGINWSGTTMHSNLAIWYSLLLQFWILGCAATGAVLGWNISLPKEHHLEFLWIYGLFGAIW